MKRTPIKTLVLTGLISFSLIKAQSGGSLTFSEVMFIPSESNGEFIEIYNSSDIEIIDLSKLKFKYSTSTADNVVEFVGGRFLLPNKFAVILEADYDFTNGVYKNLIPPDVVVLKLGDNAFGATGMANTSSREIYLLNSSNEIIDSYTYSADNAAGISDEKYLLNKDNNQSNWQNSLLQQGTPGKINSVTPIVTNFDLSILIVGIHPSIPIENEIVKTNILIKNRGALKAENFKIEVYADSNHDGETQSTEMIFDKSFTELDTGDSIFVEIEFAAQKAGENKLLAKVVFEQDENISNNLSSFIYNVVEVEALYNELIINEIMYAPGNNEPEWIEIYNRSNRIINIKKWKIGDPTQLVELSKEDFYLDPMEYLVISDDQTISNYHQINSKLLVKALPTLNNNGDEIILKSNQNKTIDSVKYASDWGGAAGGSIERVSTEELSNLKTNWASSVALLKSTPGSANSIIKRDHDLAVSIIKIEPAKIIVGEEFLILVLVKNQGYKNANQYVFKLYNDANKDSVAQPEEQIYAETKNELGIKDSIFFQAKMKIAEEGAVQLIAELVYEEDENQLNNRRIVSIYVYDKPVNYNDIIINEIMFAPTNDEPEWVELQNISDKRINLKNWKIADNSSSVIITTKDFFLLPNEFLVICGDSSLFSFHQVNSKFIIKSMPAFNNNGDDVVIKESYGFTIDSLKYDASWIKPVGGRSLERFSASVSTINNSNWNLCVASTKGTPGIINSITKKDYDLSISKVETIPRIPIVDDEFQIKVTLKNIGYKNSKEYTLQIYFDANRDSVSQSNERIYTNSQSQIAINDSLSLVIPYKIYEERSCQIIVDLIYEEDQNQLNNKVYLTFEVKEKPVNINSIIINEVMFAPTNDEPEWVELQNVSSKTINLKNWKIGDNTSSVIITTKDMFVSPDEYIVVCSDSSLLSYHAITSKLLVRTIPLFNNNGDDVIIKESSGITIDSLRYYTSWVSSPNGRSLERYSNLEPTIEFNNWRFSEAEKKSTPGITNSITRRNHDLSIKIKAIIPQHPSVEEDISISVRIKNIGFLPANQFFVNLFIMDNADNSLGENKELIYSTKHERLEINDSTNILAKYRLKNEGVKKIIAVLDYEDDENLLNNESIFSFTVLEKQTYFNDVIINEVMFAPMNDEPEWVELLNISDKNINLKNWKIADNTSSVILTTKDFYLLPNEYLIICGDSSLLNYYSIKTKILFRAMPTFNNNGDEVIIKTEAGSTVDSLKYLASWVVSPKGRTIERMVHNESTVSQLNWKYSEAILKGTPGKLNSISTKNYDLAVSKINSQNKYAVMGSNFKLYAEITNKGKAEIPYFTVDLFRDANDDGNTQSIELIEQFSFHNLSSRETKNIEYSIVDFNEGKNKFIVEVNYPNDEFMDNNQASYNINGVTLNETRGDLVVNEIMYAPTAPESEWIEILNNSNKSINLNGYKIANSKDTINVINKSYILLSNEIILITKDTIGFSKYPVIPKLHISSFPTLINSKEKVILLDSLERVIDSLEYKSTWGGTGGKSLERIEPGFSSVDSASWKTTSSKNGGTPGYINSNSMKNYDVEISKVFFSPDIPAFANEVKINTQITNIGKQVASFHLCLKEILSDGSVEIREETITQSLQSGESSLFEFAYSIKSLQTKHTFEVSAILERDENKSNNSLVSSIYPAYNSNSIVINEIMYSPINGEPEWIELYNNSNYSISIDEWSICDILPTSSKSKINADNFLLSSNEYLVVTKDTTIKNYHGSIKSKLIVVGFPNLNNDADGVVIKDFYNRTIDSVRYESKWGGTNGKSLERVKIESHTNENENWGSSRDIELSTPGRLNSLTPKQFDLTITSVSSFPAYPIYGEKIKIAAQVKNNGLSTADNFAVLFYNIENADTFYFSSGNGVKLSVNESALIFSQVELSILKPTVVLCRVIFQNDEDTLNNYFSAEIKPGVGKYSVLVSEIMYDPLKGESEWIEIFNSSNESVNLKDWSISDHLPSPTIGKISSKDVILLPGEYAVIATDTTKFQYVPTTKFFQTKFGTLGNSNDGVIIYDSRGAVVDSLSYSSTWGGLNGRSLERISFAKDSNDSINWASSIEFDFATPGFSNSINNLPSYNYGSIIINEIMYEPASNNCEFIEFYNNLSDSIQIGGMSLTIGKNNKLNISSNTFKLPPKEFVALSSDSSIFSSYSGIKGNQSIIISDLKFSLSNSGSQLTLKDLNRRTLDSVYYQPSWHNKNILSTKNRSLERLNPGLSSNNPSNWNSSVHIEGATPVFRNSIFSENTIHETKVTINPNPFSPDNDGFEDYAIINFDLSKPFSQVRIKVFDSHGRLVRTIAENNLAASQNSIIFDGLDDNGNPLRIGIYILLIESTADNSGNVEIIKLPIVVARKL